MSDLFAADAPTSSATISECGRYRYDLRRTWDDALRACLFVMLNPSTADATADDPTIRRCVGFARAWGCGGIVVVNLFALRATDPAELKKCADPVGPLNDQFIRRWAERCHPLVAAWGVHGVYKARNVAVRRMFGAGQMALSLCHLGLTKDGHPRHPLYLPNNLTPVPWEPSACARHCETRFPAETPCGCDCHRAGPPEGGAAVTANPTDRELARDLWGRAPTKPRKCIGCGLRAEIYEDGCCWLCIHTGQRDMVKRTALPHEWRRLVNGGG